MTHSPSKVVQYLLIGLGLGTRPPVPPAAASAWPVYARREPGAPDNAVTVYDTQGHDNGRIMLTGETVGPKGFQVRVRAKDGDQGWTKAEAIAAALAEEVDQTQVTVPTFNGVPAASYVVHCCARVGDVLDIGKDTSSERVLFTVNATLRVKEIM